MRRALCLIAGLLVVTFAHGASVPPPQSGFLDSYPALQPDPKHEGSFIYMPADASLKGFTKIHIDPILIWYAKDSTYQGIDPNELSAVTENFRKALIKNLEPKYPVVDTDGADVLRLRLAITNTVRRPSFNAQARYNAGSVFATHASCSRWLAVRFCGFFHNAQRTRLTVLDCDRVRRRLSVPAAIRAAFHVRRRWASKASPAQTTTWKGSAQRTARGQYAVTISAIQRALSEDTCVIAAHRAGPRSSKNRLRVAWFAPSAAQTSRPVSWSTTTSRYLWFLR